MSEVVGYLLVFGILSALMVMSMVAFGVAQELAQERAVQLEAESAAARVAGVVVQTALAAEQEGSSLSVAFDIDLPDQLEGHDYQVYLEPGGLSGSQCTSGSFTDQVCVVVPALDIAVASPVFAAAAPTNVAICSTDVSGGSIVVLFDTANVDDPNLEGDYAPACGAGKFIFVGVGS